MEFPTSEDIKKGLKDNAYINIPFEIPEGVVQDAIDMFSKFIDGPQNIRDTYTFTTKKGENKCNEIGYKHYSTYDSKLSDIHWIQYNRSLIHVLTDSRKEHTEKEMIEKFDVVYDHACKMFSKFVDSLEQEFPNLRSKLYEVGSDVPRFSAVRFIQYGTKGAKPDDYLGFTPHFDSGSCTVSLAESSPGLLLGHELASVKPVKRKEKNALCFCGLYFYKLTSDDFAPSLHFVDARQNKQVNDNIARQVVIFFVDHNEFKKCDVCEKVHW